MSLDLGDDGQYPRPSLLIGDMRTGRITTTLPVEGAAVEAVLNGAGTISATVNLRDPDVQRLDLRLNAAAVKSFLAFEYGGRILNAGPIWTRQYSRATGRLTLSAAGLVSLFDKRFVLPAEWDGATPADETVTYRNLTLAGIATLIVQDATDTFTEQLPLVYGEVDDGGNERTYYGYEFGVLGERLAQLSAVDGGPDIQFRPRRSGSNPLAIEWVMATGRPDLVQSGPPHRVDDLAPEADLVDLSVAEDASQLSTRHFATGTGEEVDLLTAVRSDYTLPIRGYPLTESLSQHQSVVVQSTLNTHAVAELNRRKRPHELRTLTLRRDGYPALGTYAEGDLFQVLVEDDPWLGTEDLTLRCVGIRADLGQTVTVICSQNTAAV